MKLNWEPHPYLSGLERATVPGFYSVIRGMKKLNYSRDYEVKDFFDGRIYRFSTEQEVLLFMGRAIKE